MRKEVVRFSDIPGNRRAKETLRQGIASGRAPHALLLSGPPGSGKMLMARAYMALAHCEHPHDGEPCGECRNCRLHADMAHPDIHYSFPIVKNKSRNILVSDDRKEEWLRMLEEVPAMAPEQWLEIIEAGNSQPLIYVDEAQEIIRNASFPPYASHVKFFVIWLPEKLQLSAANKLLKIIEEPPHGISFILVSDNELEVLPTIFSRTQRVRLGRVEDADMAIYLQHRWGLDGYAARQAAPLVAGSLIKADELGSHNGETKEFRATFQTLMRDAYSRNVKHLKTLSEQVAAYGRPKIIRFLSYITLMIRENFIYNLHVPQLNRLSAEDEAFSRNFSPFINTANVESMISETDRTRRDIERNGNGKIVIFDYFLHIIGLIRKNMPK